MMRSSATRVGVMLRLRIFWYFTGSSGTSATLPSSSGAAMMIYTLASRLS